MMEFLAVTFSGLITGITYAQMALGLSLIYGVMRLVNFAHGEMLTLGILIICSLQHIVTSPFHMIPLVILMYIGIFFILNRFVFKHLVGKDETTQFMAMAALSMLILNVNLFMFHADTYSYVAHAYNGCMSIGGLVIQKTKLISSVLSFSTILFLFLFLNKSLLGTAIRAISVYPKGAIYTGLPVRKLHFISLILASFLMGVSGFSLVLNMDVSVHSAPELTLLCFTIVILGGLGSVAGTVFSSLIIGLSEAYVVYYGSSLYKNVTSFILLTLVLLLKPKGIFGQNK
ncbi:MAG: High-affinity branched-chain amino acid transport system permease protein LivH [Holosporales bacterium]